MQESLSQWDFLYRGRQLYVLHNDETSLLKTELCTHWMSVEDVYD